MKADRSAPDELIVGLVSVSDRAAGGVYQDQGIPGLRDWLARALASPWQAHERLIADEQAPGAALPVRVAATLMDTPERREALARDALEASDALSVQP